MMQQHQKGSGPGDVVNLAGPAYHLQELSTRAERPRPPNSQRSHGPIGPKTSEVLGPKTGAAWRSCELRSQGLRRCLVQKEARGLLDEGLGSLTPHPDPTAVCFGN